MGFSWDTDEILKQQLVQHCMKIEANCKLQDQLIEFQGAAWVSLADLLSRFLRLIKLRSQECSHMHQKNHTIALKGQVFRLSFEKLS